MSSVLYWHCVVKLCFCFFCFVSFALLRLFGLLWAGSLSLFFSFFFFVALGRGGVAFVVRGSALMLLTKVLFSFSSAVLLQGRGAVFTKKDIPFLFVSQFLFFSLSPLLLWEGWCSRPPSRSRSSLSLFVSFLFFFPLCCFGRGCDGFWPRLLFFIVFSRPPSSWRSSLSLFVSFRFFPRCCFGEGCGGF